jgi:hypothetical protein
LAGTSSGRRDAGNFNLVSRPATGLASIDMSHKTKEIFFNVKA